MIIRRHSAGSLALNDTQDSFEGVSGWEHTENKINARLKFWKGEWRFDVRIGMPYKQDILGRKIPDNVVQGIFRDALQQTPGVDRVISVQIERSKEDRKVSVSWECRLIDGSVINDQIFIVGAQNE